MFEKVCSGWRSQCLAARRLLVVTGRMPHRWSDLDHGNEFPAIQTVGAGRCGSCVRVG